MKEGTESVFFDKKDPYTGYKTMDSFPGCVSGETDNLREGHAADLSILRRLALNRLRQ